ncbi:delta-aminolevulinic acid dehydratase [Candidatus Marinimicrobia bacterium]|nr:delta-aminolevulinic acid dehydratase [Candidatus Neomarinimicrobiota bacterium]
MKENFLLLKKYCEKEKFKGWDPYDGLNSRFFQSLPIKNYDIARLIWIQLFKRNPINLRKLFLIDKEYNAKGISLLLRGYCNLFKINQNSFFGKSEDIYKKIILLADILIKNESKGYSGSCWGYNFDWQARRLFFFPKGTPNVVVTSFCVDSLINAYNITKNEKYLVKAISAGDFVIKDLIRTNNSNGLFLSYSPIEGNNTVYNASLLGAKLLSQIYVYTNDSIYLDLSKEVVSTACKNQNLDGSWYYGLLPIQNWIDSFHTGYNLVCINSYQKNCNDNSFRSNLDEGFKYYIDNFFDLDGFPKYYHNRKYPVDIHCPAQLFVTLSKLNKFSTNKLLAEKVLKWTLLNMQDEKGYFYYQKNKFYNNKNSYMRWNNAFMFDALSYYYKNDCQYKE